MVDSTLGSSAGRNPTSGSIRLDASSSSEPKDWVKALARSLQPLVRIASRIWAWEHQQHLELASNYSKIAVAYTQIVTISTDDHHTTQEFRASVGAEWTFLSDPGRVIQKDLAIQEYTDPEHNPMIPHTLVLKPDLVIHSIYNGYWFWGRPSVVDLWHDLRAVTSEIRPDWDLSRPGLREAWDAGDFSRFHGWNKRVEAE